MPLKFVALSPHMTQGFDSRIMNLLKQDRNASVVESETTSKWTALVAKQKNVAI